MTDGHTSIVPKGVCQVGALVLFTLMIFYPALSSAQQNENSEAQEVFLSFNYDNLVNTVLISYYKNGDYYLPVSQLLSALKIQHKVEVDKLRISGFYLNRETPFSISFSAGKASIHDRTISFTADDYMIKELDFYLKASVLEDLFGFRLTVDLSNLLLKLESKDVLPVKAEYQRERRRESQKRASFNRSYYPLRFPRNEQWFDGGFLDYNLSANLNSNQTNLYTYNLGLGTEILSGDVQGQAFGTYSELNSNFITSGLRWRHVSRGNTPFKQISIGQLHTDRLQNRSFTGISIKNEPFEPLYIFDQYQVDGTTIPGSDVELYFNGDLYDVQKATKSGYYRFLTPIVYGSSRLKLKVYDPSGGTSEIYRRIRIPYTFIPSGKVYYNLNAGRLDNALLGTTEQSYMAQGDVAYGFSNWLTSSVGLEYLSGFDETHPQFYSRTSARVLNNHLLNIDIAPQAFYKFSANVVYGSSLSWGFDYTYFDDSPIYNRLNLDHELSANLFVPFTMANIPFNIRLTDFSSFRDNYSINRYRAALNARINRLNAEVSYEDQVFGDFSLDPTASSRFRTALSYYFSRFRSIPSPLRDVFVRAQVDYNAGLGQLQEIRFQLSKNFSETGQIQLAASRDILNDFGMVSLSLTFDLGKARSITTARVNRDNNSLTQTLRGSIGYDSHDKKVLFSNRQQVGRAAAAVRLYVDNNNNKQYDDGDTLIPDNAVRMDRTGRIHQSGNGVTYISQLQPYYRINLTINKSAVKNPLLVPELKSFSMITDPNQYKPIDIPFYTSGVISGKVQLIQTDGARGLSGIRLYLKGASEDQDFSKELRTFSDGSFYSYEIPPGSYHLFVDKTQLDFLHAVSKPDTLNFRVKALAEGDFLENLNITLVPDTLRGLSKDSISSATPEPPEKDKQLVPETPSASSKATYLVQLASYQTESKAYDAFQYAQKLFGKGFSLIFNEVANLYGLRSKNFNNKEEALDALFAYQHSKFNEPALVVISDAAAADLATETIYRAVQIGAFSEKEKALKFAHNSQSKMGKETVIHFDPVDQLNKVYLLKTINADFDTLNQILTEVLKEGFFKDAFIAKANASLTPGLYQKLAFSYQIRIEGAPGALDDMLLNTAFSKVNYERLKKNVLVFKNIRSWNTAVALKEKLSKVPNIGQPVIMLIQRKCEKANC